MKHLTRPTIGVTVAVACFAFVCAMGTTSYVILKRDRDADLQTQSDELRNVSAILADGLGSALKALDLVQLSVLQEVAAARMAGRGEALAFKASKEMHALLKAKITGLPQVQGMNLVDDRGKLLNLSREWPAPEINVSDRDYFQTLRAHPEMEKFISEPVQARGSGALTFHLARPIRSRSGDFKGLVLTSVSLPYFEEKFRVLGSPADLSVTLFHRDGTVLARHPHFERSDMLPPTRALAASSALRFGDVGLIEATSHFDSVPKLMAVRALDGWPLGIVVARPMGIVLAAWWQKVFIVLAVAPALMLFACGGAWMLWRHIRQGRILSIALSERVTAEAERKVQAVEMQRLRETAALTRRLEQQNSRLEEQNERFEAALANMAQGIVMFDREERLVVFNETYSKMYGFPSGALTRGMALEDMVRARSNQTPSFNLEETVRRLRARIAYDRLLEGESLGATAISYRPLPDGGCVITHTDISHQRRAEQRIQFLAHHDALTELSNRAAFNDQLHLRLEDLTSDDSIGLMFIDLDQFKMINDTLGHSTGDAVLRAVANRLKEVVGSSSVIARLGGDEFAFLCEGELGRLGEAAQQVIARLSEPYSVEGLQLSIGASIGIALAPQDAVEAEALLRCADVALYAAKSDGRGRARFFSPEMDLKIRERRRMEADLRAALLREEFEIHYQPLICLASGQIAGFEALVRWRHPEQGFVSPAVFIPIAEEAGLIHELGERVLKGACREALTWPETVRVAVNISPVQFHGAELAATVRQALAETGLPAARLELEVTESVLLADDTRILATLSDIQSLGVSISLDDFGTGYSSLSYLRLFPFNKLKIDQTFVREMSTRDDCAAIVRSIIWLASSLGMSTTAEGVETDEQRRFLQAEGCTQAQGFLYSRALPGADLKALLIERPSRLVA